MYSFTPIATELCHNGWFILATCMTPIVVLFILAIDEWDLSEGARLAAILIWGIFMYNLADWTAYEKTYTNEKVVAEFVGFQPEGYNEKSGKSRADHHYMYVIYKVPGDKLVIMQSSSGLDYPKHAILYKN